VREIGDDVARLDVGRALVEIVRFDPVDRLPDLQGIRYQNGADDPIEIRSGDNPHASSRSAEG